jgi:hypothetical protein
VNQSFETEAEGFTFQSNADSDSDMEIVEQTKDHDQSDEEARTSIYAPSSEATPPASPLAPLSHPTTPFNSSLPPPQSEFEPTAMPTGSKRNQNSPSLEPKKPKKVVTSAIRHALELSTEDGQSAKRGLLKFFSKGTQEDKMTHFTREDERSNEARLQEVVNAENVKARKRVRERDLARERQRKHRKLMKAQEIRSGGRSPGGTKRKVSDFWKKKNKF